MLDLYNKPWLELDEATKSQVQLPRGMIGLEERLCLHYLARYCTNGEGLIVDAGAFIGASAYCLASGLAANAFVNSTKAVIHSYDQFVVNEDYVGETISRSVRPIKSGENFFDIFRWQTGEYKETVVSHPGDLLAQRWGNRRIDILFIDIAKATRLNAHICREFFPCLVPGKSFVVQQDFYHCWHPYIHITMEYLADHFEIVDRYVPPHSRLYRLTKGLTNDQINRLAAYDFTPAERLALLDRYIDKEEGPQKAMARTIKLCQLWMDGDFDGYGIERDKLEREFPTTSPSDLYVYQVKQLDDLVAKQEPCRFM